MLPSSPTHTQKHWAVPSRSLTHLTLNSVLMSVQVTTLNEYNHSRLEERTDQCTPSLDPKNRQKVLTSDFLVHDLTPQKILPLK